MEGLQGITQYTVYKIKRQGDVAFVLTKTERQGDVAFVLTKTGDVSMLCLPFEFICFQQLTLTGGLLFVVAPAPSRRRARTTATRSSILPLRRAAVFIFFTALKEKVPLSPL